MAERLRLLSFIDGEDGYCCVLAGDEGGASALRATGEGTLEARSETPISEGRATLESSRGELEISWSPAGPRLQFAVGDALVEAHAVATSGHAAGEAVSGPGVAWDLPATGYSALRTLWATNPKGSLILLVAVRAEEAHDHGEELIGAARLISGAEPYAYLEPLLSTEYDASGAHVRATLELWPSVEEHAPERGGGLRTTGGALAASGGRLETARFAWSLDGSPATGGYEILTP